MVKVDLASLKSRMRCFFLSWLLLVVSALYICHERGIRGDYNGEKEGTRFFLERREGEGDTKWDWSLCPPSASLFALKKKSAESIRGVF